MDLGIAPVTGSHKYFVYSGGIIVHNFVPGIRKEGEVSTTERR
jgi:hypothetical protein